LQRFWCRQVWQRQRAAKQALRTAALEHFLINTALVDLYHVRELTRGTACHPPPRSTAQIYYYL
jgi:hypothetical protein